MYAVDRAVWATKTGRNDIELAGYYDFAAEPVNKIIALSRRAKHWQRVYN